MKDLKINVLEIKNLSSHRKKKKIFYVVGSATPQGTTPKLKISPARDSTSPEEQRPAKEIMDG